MPVRLREDVGLGRGLDLGSSVSISSSLLNSFIINTLSMNEIDILNACSIILQIVW